MKEPYQLVYGDFVGRDSFGFPRLDTIPPAAYAYPNPEPFASAPPMSLLNSPAIQAQIEREITAEDKALLASSKVGSTTPHLKKIRAVHHQAARLMATGMKEQEVSLISGLCPSRLSILKHDPAFSDLISFYEKAEQDRFASVQDRMVMLGMVASEELNERIMDGAEDVSTKDLTEIMKVALDRGGYAPVTKSENKSLHVVLGPDDMEKIKHSVEGEQNGKVFHRRATKILPTSGGVNVDSAAQSGSVCGTETLEGITLEGLGL